MSLAAALAIGALTAGGVMVVAAVVALLAGRFAVVDVAWGLALAAVAAVQVAVDDGSSARRIVLLVLTCLWGLRLAVHIGRRSRGTGEDPRYADLLEGHSTAYALVIVFGLQGVLVWVVSLPIMFGMVATAGWHWWGFIGMAVWAVGLVFEAVGDWQLDRYQRQPRSERPSVLDTGLWRYTRHPNYFGDACVWLGIWLVAADGWAAAATLASPLVMTYLLVNGSGKRLLERRMADRPAYADYMRRTSGFLPLPPRTRA